MVGYSMGHTMAGHGAQSRVELMDLPSVLLAAVGALVVREWAGRWSAVALGVGLGIATGFVVASARRRHKGRSLVTRAADGADGTSLFRRWRGFMLRTGVFQSRLTLAFVYFVLLAPFALAGKLGGSPLQPGTSRSGSFWLPRNTGTRPETTEEARKQF